MFTHWFTESHSLRLISLLALAAWFPGYAFAEPKGQDAGLQQVLRKAQGVVRQLTQEKAALEAEKTAWIQEKAAMEARIKALEANAARADVLQGELARSKEDAQRVRDSLDSQLSQSRQREQSILQKHREVIAKAKDIRADNELLINAVQEREQWIASCGERNKDLVQVNQEVVKKYKDKSLWDELTELEPFTGIAGVRAESAAEEYRYKIQHLKNPPAELQTPVESKAKPAAPEATDDDEEENP